jgi:hypothetical protein
MMVRETVVVVEEWVIPGSALLMALAAVAWAMAVVVGLV